MTSSMVVNPVMNLLKKTGKLLGDSDVHRIRAAVIRRDENRHDVPDRRTLRHHHIDLIQAHESDVGPKPMA